MLSYLFFFNDTATTEIYTLSLHDALPISSRARAADGETGDFAGCPAACNRGSVGAKRKCAMKCEEFEAIGLERRDRKSTRLNSSHSQISYAVFCLKKKKKIEMPDQVLSVL